MNRNNIYLRLSSFMILTAIMACAIPGQKAQPVPTSTFDPVMATSIVGTVQASTRLTEQSYTPTPIPTETLIPTPVISSYGTSLTKRDDGSALFTDHRAGIQILFPANWLAMRVGEPEYYQAWEKEGAQNPNLLDAITSIQNLDLNTFRITAYDIHPEHVLYDNIPKINIVFLQGDSRTLKKVDYDERTRTSILKDYKSLPSEFKKTSTDLEILIISHQWQSTATANQPYIGYYKGIVFKVPDGTMFIDLFIPLDQKEPLELELDQIVDSVTLLNP